MSAPTFEQPGLKVSGQAIAAGVGNAFAELVRHLVEHHQLDGAAFRARLLAAAESSRRDHRPETPSDGEFILVMQALAAAVPQKP